MVRPANLKKVKFTGLRARIAHIVESAQFINFIAVLIVINAILLGLETYPTVAIFYGTYIKLFDFLILAIFLIEIAMKLYIYRGSFFRDGWNIFDFVIVVGSLIPAGGSMTVLRTLRIFRVLRLMSIIPSMRRVLTALFHAIPGMTSILGIMFIIFYVAAVVATQVFGGHADPQMQDYFGTMGNSMYTLFQVMTLEGWPDIAKPTIALFPWAWVYFVLFIVITSFAILNLFVGIIVDAMDIIHDFENEDKGVKELVQNEVGAVHQEIDQLRGDLTEIKKLLKKK